MIPTLFKEDFLDDFEDGQDVVFPDHGICDLVGIIEGYAEETADDGHEWELVFKYHASEEWHKQIKYNRIVVAKVNTYQNPQAFRIYSIQKQIDGTVEVKAQHIYYDLANTPVKPYTSTRASDALRKLKTEAISPSPFTFSTNIPASVADDTFEFSEPRSMLKVLLDGDNSILGTYGGDLRINNCAISLRDAGGEDRGVSIDYGVDLIDMTQEENITNTITGIYPYYKRSSTSSKDEVKDSQQDITPAENSWIANKYIRSDNGNEVSYPYNTDNKAQYDASPFISITPNHAIVFPLARAKNPVNTNIGYAFYNADQQYISGQSAKTSVKQVTIPVPSNARYFRLTRETYEHDQIEYKIISQIVPDPIIYGSVINGPGTHKVQKIVPVDFTKFFPDKDPTVAQLNTKAQEWVDEEDIGKPEVSLTLSYDQIDQNIHMYDAVQVRFPALNVDVKSKVTKYKYDFIKERVEEIEVGSTKESPFFTLSDASRLKRGLIPPDRIEDGSITSSKYGSGSIGSGALAPGAIGDWELEDYAVDWTKIKEKAIHVYHFSDEIAKKVEDTQGGESWQRKKVARILSDQLGIPAWDLDPAIANETQDEEDPDDPTKSTYTLNTDFIEEQSIDGGSGEVDIHQKPLGKIKKGTIGENLLVNSLQAKVAKIETLETDKASVKDLNALKATVNTMKVKTAEIEVLDGGGISATSIKATNSISCAKTVTVNGTLIVGNGFTFLGKTVYVDDDGYLYV